MSGPWDLQASAGASGRSVLWRGDWATGISYNPYDAVSRGISSYISLTNNQSIDPETDSGTNWQVMAEGGAGTVGPPGPQGPAATIAVGATTTGAPGTNASVANTGTSSAAVFNFTIPRGDVGPPGPAGGSSNTAEYLLNSSTVPPTSSGQIRLNNSNQTLATVIWIDHINRDGTDVGNVLDIILDVGSKIYLQDKNNSANNQTYNVTVASNSLGSYSEVGIAWEDGGSPVTASPAVPVVISIISEGEPGPPGPQGPAATIAVGTTTTGAPGTNASVNNSGSSSAAVFNFTIPRGDVGATGSQGIQGAQGIQGPQGTQGPTGAAATATAGTTTTSAPGGNAAVTNVGTPAAAVFDFVIPRGEPGPPGPAGSGAGDVTGPAASITGEIAVYSGTSGKLIDRLTPPAGALVGTTATQTLTNKTLTAPAISSPTGLVKADVGLGNVDNTSDANKPVSTAQAAADALKIDKAIVDAKGDLIVASANDTPVRKAVGTNGHLLFPNSAQADGLEWRAGTKSDVGLANVDNTSDAAKPVSTAQAAADALKIDKSTVTTKGDLLVSTGASVVTRKAAGTNGYLLFPNSANVDGLEWRAGAKGDVGLANVDNTADTAKPVSTAQQTALNLKEDKANKAVANGYASLGADGKVPTAQLPAGGTGDVIGPASSVDSEIALFSATTGKLIKRANGTGIVQVTNGVFQAPADIVNLLPAGTILQQGYVETVAQIDSTATAAPPLTAAKGTAMFSAPSMTLRFGTSKVLITLLGIASVYSSPAGTVCYCYIWVNVNGTTNQIAATTASGYSDGNTVGFSIQFLHTPGGVGPWTYSTRFAMAGGTTSPSAHINGFGYTAGVKITSMLVQEIKQ